jgi:hypothetical protein
MILLIEIENPKTNQQILTKIQQLYESISIFMINKSQVKISYPPIFMKSPIQIPWWENWWRTWSNNKIHRKKKIEKVFISHKIMLLKIEQNSTKRKINFVLFSPSLFSRFFSIKIFRLKIENFHSKSLFSEEKRRNWII